MNKNKEGKFEEKYTYYTHNFPFKENKKVDSNKFLFKYTDMSKSFENILNKYFKNVDEHIKFLEVLEQSSNQDYINKFLTYIKIFESLFSFLNKDKPFDDKKIKELNNEILELIEKNFTELEGKNIKKYYSDKLSWINEFNLQEKLNYFLSDFGEEIFNNIENDFTIKVKQNRNDYTHLNKRIGRLDHNFISKANPILKKIIIFIYLKEILEVDLQIIKKSFQNNFLNFY